MSRTQGLTSTWGFLDIKGILVGNNLDPLVEPVVNYHLSLLSEAQFYELKILDLLTVQHIDYNRRNYSSSISILNSAGLLG